jgi:hypothetical protein
MAARSGPGIGIYITISILGVAAFGFFVATIVLVSNLQAAKSDLARLEGDTRFVTAAQRQNDNILRISSVAQQQRPAQSALGWLNDSYREVASMIGGNPTDTPEQLRSKLEAQGFSSSSVVQALRNANAAVAAKQNELDSTNQALARAREDLQAEVQRAQNVEQQFQATTESLEQKVEQYKGDLDAMRAEVDDYRQLLDDRVDNMRADSEARVASLRTEIQNFQQQNQILEQQLADCRQRTESETLSPTDEFALVDGQVIGVNTTDDLYYVNLGTDNKTQVGMTFAVYAQASDIRPDARGNYPRGKAVLEIMEIDETYSTCRVVPGSAISGNPVVIGDVIANALYDPNKLYKFVVYGDFDANGDGRLTPEERGDVENVIRQWGGEVITDLAGDVDFLVLGARPVLPIAPGPDANIEVIRQFRRKQNDVERYDRLWDEAIRTRIPVLNINRLFTLTGKPMGYLR